MRITRYVGEGQLPEIVIAHAIYGLGLAGTLCPLYTLIAAAEEIGLVILASRIHIMVERLGKWLSRWAKYEKVPGLRTIVARVFLVGYAIWLLLLVTRMVARSLDAIRILRVALRYACVLADEGVIEPDDLLRKIQEEFILPNIFRTGWNLLLREIFRRILDLADWLSRIPGLK